MFIAAENMLHVPNGHRLIKLSAHTIHILGHVRICSEIVLQVGHRGVQGCLEINNHFIAQTTAVYKSLRTTTALSK